MGDAGKFANGLLVGLEMQPGGAGDWFGSSAGPREGGQTTESDGLPGSAIPRHSRNQLEEPSASGMIGEEGGAAWV